MDRKALIREVFIGSTADIPSMLNRQRAQLQMGALISQVAA